MFPSFLMRIGLILTLHANQPTTPQPPSNDPISPRAQDVHRSGLLFDGHNDLPWRLRNLGDVGFRRFDMARSLVEATHTDIPRLRQGGLKAQFWSVYIPTEQPKPSQTVSQQIDLVHRMIARYPETFGLALTAEDVRRVVDEGRIASLIGIEGGIAIENDLALLRNFYRLGVRYMTLTHNGTLDWADAATDEARHGGLTAFGERVVVEMNRLGMLVDISHVSEATMDDVLRIAEAPVIASHSSAFALCPHPRNVPDAILKRIPDNGGVIMVNFFPGFLVPDALSTLTAKRRQLREQFPDSEDYQKAYDDWAATAVEVRGNVQTVADHIDHIVEVAGIDHVGIGGDYDGIGITPVGLEDVSGYPRLTEELLDRGYTAEEIHKILGENVLRALAEAERVAQRLRETTEPAIE